MTGRDWEGWKYDQAIAAAWAPRIGRQLHGLVPAGIAETHPGGGIDRARMVVRSSIHQGAAARLARVLVRQRAVAAAVGAKVALGQLRQVGGTAPVPPTWLVALLEAARRRGFDPGAELLGYVDAVTLSQWESQADKAAAKATLSFGDRIAQVLADAWARGDSTDKIARLIAPLLEASSRAELIAITETARWMTGVSLDTYHANGIGSWDWLDSPGACPICLALAAGGPYRLTDPAPPGHPRCRCATGPRVDLDGGSGLTAIGGLPAMVGLVGIGAI